MKMSSNVTLLASSREEEDGDASSRKEEDGDGRDNPCSNCLCKDVLELIISRLFLDDVKNFNCVCESWSHIHPPQILSPENFPISGQTQWLMCIEGRWTKLFHPLSKEPYVIENIIPARSIIRFSNNGWLLMTSMPYRSVNSSVFFFNPFTSEVINLPNIEIDFISMFFTSSPTSTDCMVIGVYEFSRGVDSICTILRGEKDWQHPDRDFELEVQNIGYQEKEDFLLSDVTPVLYRDKFYFLGEDGRLGVLKCCLNKETRNNNNNNIMTWTLYEIFGTPSAIKGSESFLVGCDEALFSVFLDPMGDWISILKLNDATMTWEPVDSLGENMFFLGSRTPSFSRKKLIEGMQNKIYLPMIYENRVVSYSLDKRRYQTIGNSSPNVHGIGKPVFSCWIETDSSSNQDQELDWLSLN